MNARTVHLHIRRLVLDAGLPGAATTPAELEARLRERLAARLEPGHAPAGAARDWTEATADAIAALVEQAP